MLWNTVREILEVAEYPVEDLAKEFGVKNPKKLNVKHTSKNVKYGHNEAEPPSAVAG
jgi:hypothetical protein